MCLSQMWKSKNKTKPKTKGTVAKLYPGRDAAWGFRPPVGGRTTEDQK